jgi:hypothetical protein
MAEWSVIRHRFLLIIQTTKKALTRAQLNKPMNTKKCDCSGRPLGTDKCLTCQSADAEQESGKGLDETACCASSAIMAKNRNMSDRLASLSEYCRKRADGNHDTENMKKTTHGGKRQNAGRKAPDGPQVTRSVSMPETAWRRFDEQRGVLSRGRWLARMMDARK